MKSNTTKRDNSRESSHNDDISGIKEIQPIDKRFGINLSTQTKPSRQTEQQHRLTLATKEQKESTSIDSLTSTAMLHPILEDNELKCPHNGVVKLKSNKGKLFKSKGIPMILESDLLNSSIIGYTNNIAGVPTPCTSISIILPTARILKKYDLIIKTEYARLKYGKICRYPHQQNNQISSNQNIMLDSNANLLLYETHIRLMYRYAI